MPGTSTRQRLILLIVSGAAFLDFLDVTVVNLAFPDLQRDFGTAAVGDLAWVVTGYAVMFAALLTPAGRLADLTGRRRVFLVGASLFLLASLASALAPSLETLTAARIVQGAGAALTLPAGLGILLAAFPPERRAAAIGIWGAAAAVAAIVGPTVGGVLVDLAGWRSVFLINLPIAALILAGTVAFVPETARSAGRLPDAAGAGLVALGIGLVVLGVTQGPDWGWGSAGALGSMAGGLALLVAALARAARHPAPAVDIRLWRIRDFSVANSASLVGGAAIYAWMLVCVLFLVEVWDYSELQAGLAMTPGAVTAALAAGALGRRLQRGGYRIPVLTGCAVLAADAAWLFAALGREPAFVSVWLPAGLVAGAAMGVMGVGLSTAAATSVRPDQYAAAIGLNLTARQVGGALGVAVMAAVLQAGLPQRGIQPFLDVLLLCGAASVAAGLLALRFGRRSAPAASVGLAPEGSR